MGPVSVWIVISSLQCMGWVVKFGNKVEELEVMVEWMLDGVIDVVKGEMSGRKLMFWIGVGYRVYLVDINWRGVLEMISLVIQSLLRV